MTVNYYYIYPDIKPTLDLNIFFNFPSIFLNVFIICLKKEKKTMHFTCNL